MSIKGGASLTLQLQCFISVIAHSLVLVCSTHFENISPYIIIHVGSNDILIQPFLDTVCVLNLNRVFAGCIIQL